MPGTFLGPGNVAGEKNKDCALKVCAFLYLYISIYTYLYTYDKGHIQMSIYINRCICEISRVEEK